MGSPSPARAVLLTAVVTAAAGGLARLPGSWASNAISALFLGVTWVLVWRKPGDVVRAHGLAFAGLFDDEPLDPKALARAAAVALLWAAAFSALCFPPFVFGFQAWFHTTSPFALSFGKTPLQEIASEIGGAALPEEAFYRGWLQTELDRALPGRVRILGAEVGWAILITSALFALGHLVTRPEPARLAVFFPSLLFGWLRARTGGVGAGVAFHAACNLFAHALGRGLGVMRD